jgi:hypothetical protein
MRKRTDAETVAAAAKLHALFPAPGKHSIKKHPKQPTVGGGPATKPHSLQIEELAKRVDALETQFKQLKTLTLKQKDKKK